VAARRKSAARRGTGAAAGRATGRRGAARRKGAARRSLRPRREPRGLEPLQTPLASDDAQLAGLRGALERCGGVPLGAYREPLEGKALLLAMLPTGAIEPTPFQRDLSPTHVRRLAEKIEETGAFLDPLIGVVAPDGGLWTPNGRHRLAAARFLGMRAVPVLLSADAALAYRILALNTEKAHNLRDRSLEVIRMARALAELSARASEADSAAELESAALLTLGLCYERDKRFAGAAYHPLLRRVDVFSTRPLRRSLAEREGWAARLFEIDARVRELVAALQARGMRSPYLRSYIVARLNPLRGTRPGAKAPAMSVPAALTRVAAAARRFDPATVRERDLALVAAVAPPPDEE
jgi:ParB family chromosome partitioning protein